MKVAKSKTSRKQTHIKLLGEGSTGEGLPEPSGTCSSGSKGSWWTSAACGTRSCRPSGWTPTGDLEGAAAGGGVGRGGGGFVLSLPTRVDFCRPLFLGSGVAPTARLRGPCPRPPSASFAPSATSSAPSFPKPDPPFSHHDDVTSLTLNVRGLNSYRPVLRHGMG